MLIADCSPQNIGADFSIRNQQSKISNFDFLPASGSHHHLHFNPLSYSGQKQPLAAGVLAGFG
ncbi:MAG: hypothetical protein WAN65_10505, partial [Candidatus Sulfotelmatobacter sp.]